MPVIAASLYRVTKSKTTSGTSGHQSSTPMVAFGWQDMTSDFLSVFHSDLRSRWNRCRVISRWSQRIRNLQEHKEQEEERRGTASRFRSTTRQRSTDKLGHTVCHTEHSPLYEAWFARGSASRGSICDSWYLFAVRQNLCRHYLRVTQTRHPTAKSGFLSA